ncbi:MAG: isochorismate synthase [Flavobacteriaceae bacterium]|jgi:isochorismate synthase|nr:isochorismate synthase [Flavobacteriaceae bacterium]
MKIRPFALIRLPKEREIFFLNEENSGGNKYFFTSFDNSKQYKFYFSNFQNINASELEENFNILLKNNKNPQPISENDYLKLLQKTVQFLQEKKTHKIVISREKWVEKTNIQPLKSFLFLCQKYPNSFCHLSFWNEKEVWLGATPEILGTYENSTFRTMSLAGTLPDDENFQWSEKERTEQQFVTDYIREKLQNFSEEITADGAKDLHLGHVKHLVTSFSARLKDENLLPLLIQSLHPTPAVCGLPLETSRDFILENESYDRDFYTGYIGLETPKFKKYFVNLRSGKLYLNGALLFIGGGITAQSDPEKEWQETELKSRFVGESL